MNVENRLTDTTGMFLLMRCHFSLPCFVAFAINSYVPVTSEFLSRIVCLFTCAELEIVFLKFQ